MFSHWQFISPRKSNSVFRVVAKAIFPNCKKWLTTFRWQTDRQPHNTSPAPRTGWRSRDTGKQWRHTWLSVERVAEWWRNVERDADDEIQQSNVTSSWAHHHQHRHRSQYISWWYVHCAHWLTVARSLARCLCQPLLLLLLLSAVSKDSLHSPST